MNIQDFLNKLKNAVYGSEVKMAIHDAIKKVYDDAAEAGNANMEVEMARGTEPTLNDRLGKMDDTDERLSAQLAQMVYYLMWEGAEGDGVTNDSEELISILDRIPENSTVELSGRTFLIGDSNIDITKQVKFKNGTFLLRNSTIEIPTGVNGTFFDGVIFDGVDKASDGVVVNHPSKEHRFINCTFKNNNHGLRTVSNMDTQQDLYVRGCTFSSNEIGMKMKDLKRVTITGNKFYANGIGFLSETVDFQGIGMIFSDNYLNGNKKGAIIHGGLYDSLISNNIFDHNNHENEADDGFGLEVFVPTDRYVRNVSVINNIARNNGDYSFKFIIEGYMNYSNISNNSAHLDRIDNLLIDYSGGSFSNNQISSNYFNDSSSIIDNGTPLETANAMFSPFRGGSVRGKTDFNVGVQLSPRQSAVFTNDEGFMQYLDNGLPGLYNVTKSVNEGSDSIANKRFLMAEWVTTNDRPTSDVPAGYMVFDVTLNQPIWRATGDKWVDAMGSEV